MDINNLYTAAELKYFKVINKLINCLHSMYTEGHTCGKNNVEIYKDIESCIDEVRR